MENEENIKLLKEIIQGERKKVAVFVGAGVSDPLGIKTWKKLLLEMANEFNCEIDIEECISKKGYPGTASEIYNHIGNHEDYLRFLHIQFEPTKCNFTSLHLKIIDFFHTIFTTNFDSAFEKAFYDKKRDFNTQKFPNFDPFTLFERPTIVYLHGNNDENKYIFRKEEYEVYYPSVSGNNNGSYELENFLKDVLSKISLVFIGFSFNDTYFKKFLKKALKEELLKEKKIHKRIFQVNHPRKSVNHFVIMSNDEPANIDEIKKIGLRVILYEKEKYVEIEYVIDKLTPTTMGSIEEVEHAK